MESACCHYKGPYGLEGAQEEAVGEVKEREKEKETTDRAKMRRGSRWAQSGRGEGRQRQREGEVILLLVRGNNYCMLAVAHLEVLWKRGFAPKPLFF